MDLVDYKDLCVRLDGDWLNAVGGSNGMINPLQVRPSPKDEKSRKRQQYILEM